jgi:hypothetical protein
MSEITSKEKIEMHHNAFNFDEKFMNYWFQKVKNDESEDS